MRWPFNWRRRDPQPALRRMSSCPHCWGTSYAAWSGSGLIGTPPAMDLQPLRGLPADRPQMVCNSGTKDTHNMKWHFINERRQRITNGPVTPADGQAVPRIGEVVDFKSGPKHRVTYVEHDLAAGDVTFGCTEIVPPGFEFVVAN